MQYTFRMLITCFYLFDFNDVFMKLYVDQIEKCGERMVKMVVNSNLLIINKFLNVFHHYRTVSSPPSFLLQLSFMSS